MVNGQVHFVYALDPMSDTAGLVYFTSLFIHWDELGILFCARAQKGLHPERVLKCARGT